MLEVVAGKAFFVLFFESVLCLMMRERNRRENNIYTYIPCPLVDRHHADGEPR